LLILDDAQRPSGLYRILRLRYARWLLANTDRSVTDIALATGFPDCAHFSRQFKACHGFNPTDSRSAMHDARTTPLSPFFARHNAGTVIPVHLAAQRVFD
jgi:AraC-like DNA-binding protein